MAKVDGVINLVKIAGKKIKEKELIAVMSATLQFAHGSTREKYLRISCSLSTLSEITVGGLKSQFLAKPRLLQNLPAGSVKTVPI